MKALGVIIGIIVVLVLGVGVYVVVNSGSLIKTAVETIGTEVLGVEVSLDSAEISLTEGSGELRGLTIGNPAGFGGSHAMRLGQIKLVIDVAEMSEELVVIKSVVIDKAELAIVAKGTTTNLQVIMATLDSTSTDTAEPVEDEGSDVKLIIDKFVFSNAKTSLESDLLVDASVDIPDLNLTGIGRKEDGATIREVVKQILAPIVSSSTQAVAAQGLDIEGAKQGLGKKLQEKLGSGLDVFRRGNKD